MVKPNFAFQKRQKELEKKRKNEEKMRAKLAKKNGLPAEGDAEADPAATDEPPADPSAAPPQP